ncbi:MAG: galactose oxidase-like domain-containing protein [Pseudomonadota bacterium]
MALLAPTASASQLNPPLPTRTIAAAPTTLGPPATFGQWSDVQPWPVIPIHANLLPNGRVIAWDATPDDFDDDPHTTENYTTRVTVWDPLSNSFTNANNDTNADLFCAGSSHLWDGRILFAGGDSGIGGLNGPLSNTSVYDPDTNTWEQMEDMAAPRWYSSNAALANGETLTYAGTYAPAPVAEVFQHDETWRSLAIPSLTGISKNYQWMQTIPDGRVMTFGPQNTLATIDPQGDGTIVPGQTRDEFPQRHYGSYAMYDIGKVIVSGGTEDEGGPFSYDSALLIDSATQQVTDTSPMTFARSQHNLTILADGSVLATGGHTSGAALIDPDAAVLRPEIWTLDNGQWSVMNDMQVDRQYHSVALLLPDATVLSAGGGYCGTCYELGYEEKNAEIFSPPYLFSQGDTLATRPQIALAPGSIDYNTSFLISTDNAAAIAKVNLIKLGSVTHSMNQDQRLIPLSYQRSGNSLQIQSPDNRNIAPPGHYFFLHQIKGDE